MLKKFHEIDTCDQFHKTFFTFWHTALNFDLGCATWDIIYTKKSFMKLTPVSNFIKPFWCNLCCLLAYCLKF